MKNSGVRQQSFHSPQRRDLTTVMCRAMLLGCALATSPGWAQLSVELMPDVLGSALVTLEQAPVGDFKLRNQPVQESIWDIKCAHEDALTSSNRHISVIEGCGTLSWQFNLAPYPEGGALASEQRNWFSEQWPWWLVSETGSILRPLEDKVRPEVSFTLRGSPIEVRAGPARLPALHQAPGLWLLGEPGFLDMEIVRHYFDAEEVPSHLIDVFERHERGMRFLNSASPVKPLSPVFWMGLHEWRASIGGVAGTGLILANYPVKAIELDNAGLALTLYVVLHEHAHEAVESTGVLWIDESLASYIAIKAVQETSPNLFPALADAFIEPGQSPVVSLEVLGERAAAGDGDAYAQLYQGAAFWKALDDAMINGGTQVGLLPVLPELLARAFDPSGTAKLAEMAEITGISPNELSNILNTYLVLDS